MKNNFMYNKVRIKVKGKDINRFLMRLNKKNINIYNAKKISNKEILLIVDYYNYDENTMSLVGQRHKKRYRIGDEVIVIVKSASKEEAFIDFEIKEKGSDENEQKKVKEES